MARRHRAGPAGRDRRSRLGRAAAGDPTDRPVLPQSPLGRAPRHQRASAGTASPRAGKRQRKETAANLRPPAMPAAGRWCGRSGPVPSETPSKGRGDGRDLAPLAWPDRSNREEVGSRHRPVEHLDPKPALRRRHRTQGPKLRVDGIELAINPIFDGKPDTHKLLSPVRGTSPLVTTVRSRLVAPRTLAAHS